MKNNFDYKNFFGFFIGNGLNQSLNNINLTMNMGDGNTINSTLPFNLTNSDDILSYVEYQYAGTGNYTITAIANVGNLTDNQTISIII